LYIANPVDLSSNSVSTWLESADRESIAIEHATVVLGGSRNELGEYNRSSGVANEPTRDAPRAVNDHPG